MSRSAERRSRGRLAGKERLAEVARRPAGVVIAAQRRPHQALGPVRGGAEVLEPVIDHGAFGDAPLVLPAFQPVQIASTDGGVDVAVTDVDAVVADDVSLRPRNVPAQGDEDLPENVLSSHDRW